MRESNPAKAPVKRAPRKGPKIPKKITEKHLYNAGLAYLQRFPSSAAHFRAVMARRIERSCRHHKDQDRDACFRLLDDLTAKFTDLGYLNDALYLRGMIHSLRGRGLSAMAIRMKLTMKGLGESDIREALAVFDEENDADDRMAALKLCRRKKMGPFASAPADAAQKQKWLATLGRAGFSYEAALRALETPADEVSL